MDENDILLSLSVAQLVVSVCTWGAVIVVNGVIFARLARENNRRRDALLKQIDKDYKKMMDDIRIARGRITADADNHTKE